jgi:DNA-binding CsgD family transcriptional regulator
MTDASTVDGGALKARWRKVAGTVTPRQCEVLRVFGVTGNVAETARILGLTPARVYAVFGQVGRRLGVAGHVIRHAFRDGRLSAVDCQGAFPP